jgi:PAS domain S-box-containing protein
MATGPGDDGATTPGGAPAVAPGLRLDGETLSGLLEHLADALVVADADGTVVFWNQAAERLFGWPEGEAVGRSLDLIIPERLRTRHWDGYRRVMETGHTDYGTRLLEVPALHRDGHTISIAFTVTLLVPAGERRPVAIAAVLRDDTARRTEVRDLRARVAALESTPPASG